MRISGKGREKIARAENLARISIYLYATGRERCRRDRDTLRDMSMLQQRVRVLRYVFARESLERRVYIYIYICEGENG